MSFAAIFLPSTGITTAYTDETELNSALGIYLFTWFIITFLLLCVSLSLVALLPAPGVGACLPRAGMPDRCNDDTPDR